MKEREKVQLQTNSLAKRRAASTRNAAIIFLVPAFLFLIIYIAYPIVYSFNLSCYDWNGFASNKVFVGLNNWKELMTDVVFRKAFLNNNCSITNWYCSCNILRLWWEKVEYI